jgi:hypothetical protein
MSVVCVGGRWVLSELREKHDFEDQLSRVGFRHAEFTLYETSLGRPQPKAASCSSYEVKVTPAPTGTVKTYPGGPKEDWVARFAEDLAGHSTGSRAADHAK